MQRSYTMVTKSYIQFWAFEISLKRWSSKQNAKSGCSTLSFKSHVIMVKPIDKFVVCIFVILLVLSLLWDVFSSWGQTFKKWLKSKSAAQLKKKNFVLFCSIRMRTTKMSVLAPVFISFGRMIFQVLLFWTRKNISGPSFERLLRSWDFQLNEHLNLNL